MVETYNKKISAPIDFLITTTFVLLGTLFYHTYTICLLTPTESTFSPFKRMVNLLKARLGKFILTYIVTTLIMLIGLIWLVIPAVVASVLSFHPSFGSSYNVTIIISLIYLISFVIPAIIASTLLMFAFVVTLVEGKSAWQSIKRSVQLAKSIFWSLLFYNAIFWPLLLYSILYSIIALLIPFLPLLISAPPYGISFILLNVYSINVCMIYFAITKSNKLATDTVMQPIQQ
jgi:hypothetical protein